MFFFVVCGRTHPGSLILSLISQHQQLWTFPLTILFLLSSQNYRRNTLCPSTDVYVVSTVVRSELAVFYFWASVLWEKNKIVQVAKLPHIRMDDHEPNFHFHSTLTSYELLSIVMNSMWALPRSSSDIQREFSLHGNHGLGNMTQNFSSPMKVSLCTEGRGNSNPTLSDKPSWMPELEHELEASGYDWLK